MQMADGKALRLDGFPCDFYIACQDFLSSYLHKVYVEEVQVGSLRTLINKGNINFILKQGDPELIMNSRLITLLKISYKIILNALALQLRPFLQIIVHLEQTTFIQNCYILDNVIVVQEGMEWA